MSDQSSPRRFIGSDLAGAEFRDVDLSGATITGLIDGLTVNDVEVAPLIVAELERRHPELILFRSEDPAELTLGWLIVRSRWKSTLVRIDQLPDGLVRRRVRDEWSALETLRHLVFVADDWFGRTVLGEDAPYWTGGLLPSFLDHPERLGIDPTADPNLGSVVSALGTRMDQLDATFASLTEAELTRPCRSSYSAGPALTITVRTCLQAVLDEFAAHRRYVERDLASLDP